MRQDLSLDTKRTGTSGLFVLLIVVAHLAFYFAPSFYLPFDLGELFVLGYVLVIADSGFLVFLALKLFGRVLSSNKTK